METEFESVAVAEAIQKLEDIFARMQVRENEKNDQENS